MIVQEVPIDVLNTTIREKIDLIADDMPKQEYIDELELKDRDNIFALTIIYTMAKTCKKYALSVKNVPESIET